MFNVNCCVKLILPSAFLLCGSGQCLLPLLGPGSGPKIKKKLLLFMYI